MNIKRISVYQVDLPLVEGRYTWADGKFVETFDSTIVEIETYDGLCGLGEVCPLGPFYLPAFGVGARTGIGEEIRVVASSTVGLNLISKGSTE